ncbi:MAG: TrmJ/YjtD family RNA methyltransferase [archaeon]
MISVILIEPEVEGNIGAVARVMANFGFKDLILINPKVNHLSLEATSRASHAKDILKKAKVKDKKFLKRFDYLVATTAKLGSDYNIPRCPLTPEQLADKLARIKNKTKIGIVFGRESSGLTNEEIALCDFTVTIPSSQKYPTLNISHSVAVILFSIFIKGKEEKTGENIVPIALREKKQLLLLLDQALDKMSFTTQEKKETQRILWKKLIGKAFLTKREAFALMGFLKKIR